MVVKAKFVKKREAVLDARLCLTCPFFSEESVGIYSCAAGIYKANLPKKLIEQEVVRNPDLTPGNDADNNPFILRLLMSHQCVRPECGVAFIEYKEKIPPIYEEELFDSKNSTPIDEYFDQF